MPSKKQRARAAKAAKAAAKAAEPPRQPALEGPRTLRAQLRADERAIRRLTGGWGESPVAVRPKLIMPLTDTRERLQAKLINRALADEPAASGSRDTA